MEVDMISFEQLEFDFSIQRADKELNKKLKEEFEEQQNKEKHKEITKDKKKNTKNTCKSKKSEKISKSNTSSIKDNHKKKDKDKKEETEEKKKDNKVNVKIVEQKPLIHIRNKEEHIVKNQPAINNKNSFLGAVNESNKIKEEQLKEELSHKSPEYPYVAVEIMTDAEKQLYWFMKNNLLFIDRVSIFPKMRLGDLVQLDERICKDPKMYYKVACKHVDYVIVDNETLKVICIVELDDYTHDREEVKQRDQFLMYTLQAANLPLVRIKTRIKLISKKDLRGIENYIAEYFAPPCPYCGSKMEVKSSRQSYNLGHRFYGCTGWPKCGTTIDID